MGWFKVEKPTALQKASEDLEDCRRDTIEQMQKAQYHRAMVVMLKERDKSLVDEIKRLSRKPVDQDTPE